MREDSFSDLVKEVMGSGDARSAAAENRLRREVAEVLDSARKQRKLSIRAFAKELGTSLSQVQRLLHREVGGGLTLRTICRAADVLGMSVSIHVRPRATSNADVIDFGRWYPSSVPEIASGSRRLPEKLLSTMPSGSHAAWVKSTDCAEV